MKTDDLAHYVTRLADELAGELKPDVRQNPLSEIVLPLLYARYDATPPGANIVAEIQVDADFPESLAAVRLAHANRSSSPPPDLQARAIRTLLVTKILTELYTRGLITL